MANFYTQELGGVSGVSGAVGTVDGTPVVKPSATNGHQARVRVSRGTYIMGAPAVGVADILQIAILPAGALFMQGNITSGVSLGTTTLAIGIAGTPAKYRAAAVFTAVDVPTPFGAAATIGNQTPLAGDERIIGTLGVGGLPATGQTLVIIMGYMNG